MAAILLAYLTFQGFVSSILVIYGLPTTTFALSLQSIDSNQNIRMPTASTTPSSLYYTQQQQQRKNHNCQKVSIPLCRKYYNETKLPNDYGHHIQPEVETVLSNYFSKKHSEINSKTSSFLCLLYLPPCFQDNQHYHQHNVPVVPCKSLCESALLTYLKSSQTYDDRLHSLTSEESGKSDVSKGQIGRGNWPVNCDLMPTDNCFTLDDDKSVLFHGQSTPELPERSRPDYIPKFAPLDVELGSDDGYEVEVVSLSANQIPQRRYDITDLGDPAHFRGWADVQGAGAANDYCRVVGKPKRRFLSCNLAGSSGQGHHYVSKLNFDPGWTETWFMRDMDGDGRDDYCRCTGRTTKSHVTCMKAGTQGFHGSITQGGNQYSFRLKSTSGCHAKNVNPWFGE